MNGDFVLSGLESDLSPDCWGRPLESRWDQRVPPGPCRGAVSMGTEEKSVDTRSPTPASPHIQHGPSAFHILTSAQNAPCYTICHDPRMGPSFKKLSL